MEVHDGSDIILLGIDDLFVICVAEDRENGSLNAKGRLDDVRDISFVCLGIEVGKILARGVLMLCEVVVGSVGNAPKLAPAEREEELKVGRRLGIEAKLLRVVVTKTDIFILETD